MFVKNVSTYISVIENHLSYLLNLNDKSCVEFAAKSKATVDQLIEQINNGLKIDFFQDKIEIKQVEHESFYQKVYRNLLLNLHQQIT